MKYQTKTIAVLPFLNISSSKENEYFCDGMTEEIINALSKIKNLKVTSRTSSFFFKNKKIPLSEIGNELKVSIILEGSIRISGNKMRITAQLIDVINDYHFWSETFDRCIEDVFELQDEISLLIADKLREHIGHFEIENHLFETPNISVAAYKKYLEARYYLMQLNLPDTEKGISIFKKVIEKEPDFAPAYLGVNQGYAFLGTMGLMSASDAFVKAEPYLSKALVLDENLPESQVNLAWISCWQKWDLKAAYHHLNNALEIRPEDHIYLTMSNILSVEGKFEAAHTYIEKALELDPFSAINHHFKGFLFYLQENYKKAIVCFEKSLYLKPDLPFPPLYIGTSLLLMNKAKEGLLYFNNLPPDGLGSLTKLGGTTMSYAFNGDVEMAQKGITTLETFLETDLMGSALNFLILCETMLGNYDKAMKLILQGIEYRLPMMLLAFTEPVLKPLRSLAQFQEIMQKTLGESTATGLQKRKYKKPLLNKEHIQLYQIELEVLMENEKPYLDPNLTLRSLAKMIQIPPNYLSQLLNEGFDKNFSEYINFYRVQIFKSKVADPLQQGITLLGLAFDSGFNSKTVFNTFFKKIEGKTPKTYWKEVIENIGFK